MGRMVGRVGDTWQLRAACAGVALALALAAAPAASAETTGSVGGWRSPAAGVLQLTVQASDSGSAGLRSAAVSLGGVPFDAAFFGEPDCLPNASDPDGCPAVGSVDLTVDTAARGPMGERLVPDGPQLLRVTVEDGAGQEVHFDQTITVDNTPIVSNPTVVVSIGSGTISESPPPGGGPPPPGGGAAGCASPRLSMFLAQTPLRFRRGVPVLAKGRRYRFQGQLTCLVNGRRRPAPRGTLVQVRNRVGGRTVVKPALKVRGNGLIVARLAHPSRRVLVFRVRGAGGRVVSVRIAIRVVRVKRGRS